MKLYAICWSPERSGVLIPAQGAEFDRDESPVPPQAFFWDAEEVKAALSAHIEAAVAFAVADHRRRTPAGMEPPLNEAQLRDLVEDDWSIQVYEVPKPRGFATEAEIAGKARFDACQNPLGQATIPRESRPGTAP